MAEFSGFQGARVAKLWLAVLAVAASTAGAATPPLCQFERGGLVVVARDAAAEGGSGVDIEVADGPLTLTRVGIPTAGRAAGCWLVDLDANRRFEILLALDEQAGAAPLRLLRFEWNGALLESLRIGELDPEQTRLFGGEERVEIRSNQLLRSYASRLQDGARGPRLHFRYATDTGAWQRLKALRTPQPAAPAP